MAGLLEPVAGSPRPPRAGAAPPASLKELVASGPGIIPGMSREVVRRRGRRNIMPPSSPLLAMPALPPAPGEELKLSTARRFIA